MDVATTDQRTEPTYEDRVRQWLEENSEKVKNDRRDEIATDIVDDLGADVEGIYGSKPEDRAKAVKDTIKILASSGAGHDQPSQTNLAKQGDPVAMFNGQFENEVTDLQIDGAGIRFAFKRTYKNQVNHNGPIGHNWDHNFNLWLRVTENTILCSSGQLREDLYVRHPKFGQTGFNYWVPPDGQHGIIIENANAESYIWRSPGGTRVIYQPDPNEVRRHRVGRIEGRHGNGLDFGYRDGNLVSVQVNHPDRIVQFYYNSANRIIAIEDYTGRIWQYHYDDFGDLIGVTTPATDRYPSGLTTCYQYSSAYFSGDLQHNLTQIIDPAGQMYLENEYGTAANLLSFNRVIRQRQGGGDTLFEYADVIEEFEYDYAPPERPAHQTVMVAPNGQVTRNVYNRFGNLLRREEKALISGQIKILIWRFRYNLDGNLAASLSPEGRVTQNYFGRDHFKRVYGITDDEVYSHDTLTLNERMAFGNLLVTVQRGTFFDINAMNLNRGFWGNLFPDVLGAADSADVIAKFTYEPDYQQRLTASNPRFTQSADPAHTNAPGEHPRYQETLIRYGYTGPANDPYRFLSIVHYPAAHLPDGTLQDDIVERFEAYDTNGRLLRQVDPAGNASELEYYGPGDGIKAGYLKHQIADPSGLNVRTSFEVSNIGMVTAIIHPKAYDNALAGHYRSVHEVNDLDQIVRTTLTPPFGFETRFFYDRNGKLERKEVDLKNEHSEPILGGAAVSIYAYDEQFNLLEESFGGPDFDTHLRTRHRYNRAQQRTRTTLPKGNQIWFAYNERLLLERTTRAACTPDESITRTEYGPDGLKSRAFDGRGNVTRYEYDALGRLVAMIDAQGHMARTDYDKAGNVTVERYFERQADGSYHLLARSENIYDELGRLIFERDNLFQNPLPANDPDHDYRDAPWPGTIVETLYVYDKKGRTVKVVDAKGSEHTTEYDALDRIVRVTDALGNATVSSYDAHGNLIRQDVYEQVRDPNGNILREDLFTSLHAYDELDRRTVTTDSLGNTTRFFYDSRGLLVRQVDPLGNIRRFEHDIYGRLTRAIIERTDTGLGGGTPLAPVVTRSEYDPNGNVIATIDARDNRTGREYDAFDRRIRLCYPDGTDERSKFDANSNLLSHQDGNGLIHRYDYDTLNRLKRMELDKSELAPNTTIPGATYETFSYDGLDRVLHEKNDFATTQRKFDSLGRVWEETQSLHINVPSISVNRSFQLRRDFDALGNLIRLTYPSSRIIYYHLDPLHRIERIENIDRGNDYPGSNLLVDPNHILTHHFRGRRLGKTEYGNGTSLNFSYDAGGRTIQISHTAPDGTNLLTLQHLYDGVGNMRLKNELRPIDPQRETYRYNSLYWLTKVNQDNNPLSFEPDALAPPAALPGAPPNQQTLINGLLGNLADDPADFNYQFDLLGNRIEERSAGNPPLTYATNNLNQYTNVGPDILKYDLVGNLTDDANKSYAYDHNHQLARVEEVGAGQELAQFFYDTQSRRVLSRTNGQITHYVFNGQNLLAEYRDGSCLAQYVYQYGLDSHCQIAAEGSEHWYHKDQTRSTRLLTDALGQVMSTSRYGPFGQFLERGSVYNPYAFSGRRFNETIESYDFRTRQYSTTLSRFLQRDAINADNLYSFLENNPLTAVDPLGLDRGTPEIPEYKLHLGDNFYFGETASDDLEEAASDDSFYPIIKESVKNSVEFNLSLMSLVVPGLLGHWYTSAAINEAVILPVVDEIDPTGGIYFATTMAAIDGPALIGDAIGVGSLALRYSGRPNFAKMSSLIQSPESMGIRRWTVPREEMVTVYRVEGRGNMRLMSGSNGMTVVGTKPTNREATLWLNFGDRTRAMEFLMKSLIRGHRTTVIKSFRVPASFRNRVRAYAVPERTSKVFPKNPLRSRDPYPDQFGIRGTWIDEFEANIR